MSDNTKDIPTVRGLQNFIALQRKHCYGDTKTESSQDLQDAIDKANTRLPVKETPNLKAKRLEALRKIQKQKRDTVMESKRGVIDLTVEEPEKEEEINDAKEDQPANNTDIPDIIELLDLMREFLEKLAKGHRWFHGMGKLNKDDLLMFEEIHENLPDFLHPFMVFFTDGRPRLRSAIAWGRYSAAEIKKKMVRSMKELPYKKDNDKDNGLGNMLQGLHEFREGLYKQYHLSVTDVQFLDQHVDLWDKFVEVCKALHKMSVELSSKVPMMTENQITNVLGKIQYVYQELREPGTWLKYPNKVSDYIYSDDEDEDEDFSSDSDDE